MEKTIRDILRKTDSRKISIEAEKVEAGCIAVPAYIIKGVYKETEIISKSINIEEAFDNFLQKILKSDKKNPPD